MILLLTMVCVPWYLEDLHYCFAKFGGWEAYRLLFGACNAAGIPYILPIAYIPPIENLNSYKPSHAVKTELAEFICLICGEIKKANNQISNDSNAFTLVLEGKWKKDLSDRKRFLSHITKSICRYQERSRAMKCGIKAVILGKNIPFQVQGNLDNREVIQFYNNGKMPRGLTD